ncbi:hypothetical protein [Pseudomonas sp. P7548]|uniref:hypothetical protein n=1 Tax=Pseudomonas sp. P7548 TaxID=2726981 RepID=UPI0015BF00F4|nr:hypothetical protein [Pseudomonas sp. P7548]NWE19464.1 hypothetical protein [Pseudomonas sp. P7548]
MNQPAFSLPETPGQPSETKKLMRKILRKAPKYWKIIAGAISLYALGAAILTLYIYLYVIQRVDLFMPSVAVSPAMFTWLACGALILMAALLCVITPAVVFTGMISLFSLSTSDAAKLTPRLAFLMAGGFGVMILGAYKLTSENFAWSFLVVWLLGFLGISFMVAGTHLKRSIYLKKIEGKSWYSVRAATMIIGASILFLLTVIMGIYPTTFISWSHPEGSTQSGEYLIMAISVAWMVLLCIPTITYYNTEGDLTKKVLNTFKAVCFAIFAFLVMSPSLFGLVAYSAASAVKLRNPQVSEYIVSKKYPKATLDKELWKLKELNDEGKNITILAFPLFKFGETLLLCPAKYVQLDRDHIANVSKYCFATTNSEMIQAAPTQSDRTFYLKETYCGRVFTNPPLKLSQEQRCVFAPTKSNPLAK